MVPEPRLASPKAVVQLRISLMEHTPTIWRRLLVPSGITLAKLHLIFQAAMGWENYHLHLFKIGEQSYGQPDEDFEDEDIDDAGVRLCEVLRAPMRFTYQYDFGDNWQHEVVVESIDPVPLILKFGVCLDGQRACPPEDCGGVHGFADFIEAVGDPDHEEHGDYLTWVGRPFDPEAFSVAGANAALQRVR